MAFSDLCNLVGALRVEISNTFSHIIELSQTFLKALSCHFLSLKCWLLVTSVAYIQMHSEGFFSDPDQTAHN